MTAEASSPKTPWAFVITVFVVAIAVGVIIAYLGINGYIGGPIVGAP